MTWPGFPKRLQSALKALCCLAEAGTDMQSPDIAEQINVPKSETAKILQLLVWGGFVTSRRGSKGGFQLAPFADRTTMGEVIDFFLARHPVEPDRHSPVMRALQQSMASGQQKFASLTLAEVANFPARHSQRKTRRASTRRQSGLKVPKVQNSSIRKLKKRSGSNATNRT
jgi:DNA-binding IscR family transcriptional regulator